MRASRRCQGFVGLGGWTNTRTVFQWESDHLLEVDETRYVCVNEFLRAFSWTERPQNFSPGHCQ